MEKEHLQKEDRKLLLGAVREAELLLAYTSRHGLEFDKKSAEVVAKSRYLFAEPGNWLPQDETTFWEAYNALSVALAPVSVASIKAREDEPARSLLFRIAKCLSKGRFTSSITRWYAWHYGIRTLVILILLIFVQIYWASGVRMLDKLDEQKKIYDDIRESYISSGLAVTGNKEKPEKIQAPASAEGSKGEKAILHFADNNRFRLKGAKRKYDAEYQVFERIWQPDFLRHSNDLRAVAYSSPTGNDQRKEFEKLLDEFACKVASADVTRLWLQMIQTNILPMLYGLLGAAAYVLRRLTKRIREVTYVPTQNTGFGLRMQLGALAGLAIGWFYKPEAGTVSSLSPFAISFLAGYSVELFFSAMDKLVHAFEDLDNKPQKTTRDATTVSTSNVKDG